MKMMRKNSNHLLIEISNCGGGNFALQHLKSPNLKYQDFNSP